MNQDDYLVALVARVSEAHAAHWNSTASAPRCEECECAWTKEHQARAVIEALDRNAPDWLAIRAEYMTVHANDLRLMLSEQLLYSKEIDWELRDRLLATLDAGNGGAA